MDQLESYIAKRREARALLEVQVESAKAALEAAKGTLELALSELREADIEIRALERATTLRPAGAPPTGSDPDDLVRQNAPREKQARGGRQPGSISHKWRAALSDFVAAGNNPVELQQFYLLTRARLGLSEASVRERARKYVSDGILVESNGRVSISEQAIARYSLKNADETFPRSNGEAENTTAPH